MRRLLALFLLLLASAPAHGIELAPPSGEALPPLRFLDMQGNETGLDAFKGKVVVLNLWATWCAPCREEMPSLRSLAAQLDPEEAVVLALSVDRAGQDRGFQGQRADAFAPREQFRRARMEVHAVDDLDARAGRVVRGEGSRSGDGAVGATRHCDAGDRRELILGDGTDAQDPRLGAGDVDDGRLDPDP